MKTEITLPSLVLEELLPSTLAEIITAHNRALLALEEVPETMKEDERGELITGCSHFTELLVDLVGVEEAQSFIEKATL